MSMVYAPKASLVPVYVGLSGSGVTNNCGQSSYEQAGFGLRRQEGKGRRERERGSIDDWRRCLSSVSFDVDRAVLR